MRIMKSCAEDSARSQEWTAMSDKVRQDEFVEPVVQVRVPFRMVPEIARESALRAHEFVVRLTQSSNRTAHGTSEGSLPSDTIPSR